jgi:hypothetical protein
LARISHDRAEDCAQRERAIRFNRHQGGVRQLPVCRVGHDAKSGKGQLMCGGSPGGNMGFRISGERTRIEMQGEPFGGSAHWKIDTGDVGDRGAAEGAGKPLRPNRIAEIACAVLGDNRTGDKPCPRGETRRQATGNAKTDDSGSLVREGGFKSPRETRDITATRQGEYSRPGGNPRFRLEARNGDDR